MGLGPAIEVIGTEIAIELAADQHVIDGRQDRGGERTDRLFGAAAGAQAMKLRLEIARLSARGRPGALDEGGIAADCGEDDTGAQLADAGNSGQQRSRGAKGFDTGVDLLIDLLDRRVDRVDLLEMQLQQEAVMAADATAQRCLQFVWRGFDPAMGEGRQGLRGRFRRRSALRSSDDRTSRRCQRSPSRA